MTSRPPTALLLAIAAALGGCSSEPVVYLGEQEETSPDAGWWNDFDAAAARERWEEAFRTALEENCHEPRTVCLQEGDARFDSVCGALDAGHELDDLRPCCDEPGDRLDYPERWFCSYEDDRP